MKNKYIIITTFLSALLFCLIIILSSIAPKMGKHANTFNSLGLWLAVVFILFLYIIPLILFIFGLKFMKHILTFIITLINLGIFFVAFVMLYNYFKFANIISLAIIGLGIITVIVNVFWYIVAYTKTKKV